LHYATIILVVAMTAGQVILDASVFTCTDQSGRRHHSVLVRCADAFRKWTRNREDRQRKDAMAVFSAGGAFIAGEEQ